MKTIIVNGANGYVASNFISNLLTKKYRVIALVRANKKQAPEKRMADVLKDINDNLPVDTSNLEVYNYSLLEENFAIEEKDLKQIFNGTVDYFHFAASLKFDEKSVDEIFLANVKGLENSIEVFSKFASGNSRFFYIGTAYSCGRFNGVFKEKFYKNKDISAFRNYYEQSKRVAENIVKRHVRENKLNGHVIRLSQVVGNHKTGITKTDYGIFDFAKRIYNLASRYPDETIRVHVDPDSTQNLIPVDTVTEHLTKITETGTVPEILNFVSKNSIRNSHIIEVLNNLVPMRILPVKELDRKEMNPIERMISAGMSFSENYTSTSISFDSRQRDKLLECPGTVPDDYSVAKMLEYFIETLSEKKKKSEAA